MRKYPPKIIDIPVLLLARGVFKIHKHMNYTDKIKDIFEISYGRNILFGHSVRSLFNILLADRKSEYSNLIFSSITLGDMIKIAKYHNYSVTSFDSFENSLSPNIDDLKRKLMKKPRSIVVLTPLFGEVMGISEYRKLCDKHGSLLVVDAAQGFRGLNYNDYSEADVLLHSFGPIKTMTALGGAIAVIKDVALYKRLESDIDELEIANLNKFRFRMLKYSLIAFLSRPYAYSLLAWLANVFKIDLDKASKSMTRSYKTDELLKQINKKPNWLNAWLLWRQLISYPANAIDKRAALGGIVDNNLSNNYESSNMLTYWLHPYISPSLEAESKLASRGFNTTRDTSSLTLVSPRSTPNASNSFSRLSYLPVDWRMDSQDIERLTGNENLQISRTVNYSRLHDDYTSEIWRPSTARALARLLNKFPEKTILTIGRLKSHGSHTKYSGDHVLLDLSTMDKVSYSSNQNIVETEAGVTWDKIHHLINPLGLSTVCQQSSIDFSIGGSIAGNIHGRDINGTSIEKSVAWIDIMLVSGEILHCTRQENKKIFWLIFGSQGSLGIIIKAGLYVTKNTLMKTNSGCIRLNELNQWFDVHREKISLFIARPMIDNIKDTNPTTMLTYWTNTGVETIAPLTNESNVALTKFIFWISQKHHIFMSLRHFLERVTGGNDPLISRTNAFRPPVASLKMFQTESKRYNYVVQELFCPIDNLPSVIPRIYELSTKYREIVLTGVTIRRIEPQKSRISYAKNQPAWAVMQYWKIPAGQAGLAYHKFIQKQLSSICDYTHSRPYLSYTSDYTPSDLVRWYPGLVELMELKSKLDPENRFLSDFIVSVQDFARTQNI